MEVVETSVFTRVVQTLLTDEEYRELKQLLVSKPQSGKLIRGSGGLRKLRWSRSGQRKRGGLRVVYYWQVSRNLILMLYAYPKSRQEDLTPAQLKALKSLMET